MGESPLLLIMLRLMNVVYIWARGLPHPASHNRQTYPLVTGSAHPTGATGTESATGQMLPVGSSLPEEKKGKGRAMQAQPQILNSPVTSIPTILRKK